MNNRGSILLNLLVAVLAIIVVVTLTLPFIRNYRINSELSSQARELVNDLRYAQQLSVTEQLVHGVKFDTENNLYKTIKLTSPTTTLSSVSLGGKNSFKSLQGFSDTTVEFNFYGGVDEAGEIILENINNHEITVEIKPSGYVQIQ